MGRRRKIKLNEIDRRTIDCKCGRPVQVFDTAVVSVTCYFCATKETPIPAGYIDDIEQYEREEKEEKRQEKEMKLSGKKRGRGRPKGSKNKKKSDVKVSVKRCNKKERTMDNEQNEVSQDKEVKKVTAKKSVARGKGKRGRKPSVGAKVLDYIKTHSDNNIKFNDILNVYSEERKRLGKYNASTEKRNCLSTLYILKRDQKIVELEPKSVYALKK